MCWNLLLVFLVYSNSPFTNILSLPFLPPHHSAHPSSSLSCLAWQLDWFKIDSPPPRNLSTSARHPLCSGTKQRWEEAALFHIQLCGEDTLVCSVFITASKGFKHLEIFFELKLLSGVIINSVEDGFVSYIPQNHVFTFSAAYFFGRKWVK